MIKSGLKFVFVFLIIQGCSTMKPITTVKYVDLNRFMGSWYVIGVIPTFIEKNAFNSVETYELNKDGSIKTTFTFNENSLKGPLKKYNPKGFIVDKKSNAVWNMQFVWPFKAEYRIIYLNDDYTQTVIGRTKRDYVWIMARKSFIEEKEYLAIIDFLKKERYDISKIIKVKHNRK